MNKEENIKNLESILKSENDKNERMFINVSFVVIGSQFIFESKLRKHIDNV